MSSTASPTDGARWTSRYGIPLAALVLAVVALVIGQEIIAMVLAGVAVVAIVADRLIRLGGSSQIDRDEERSARETLREEGHWPGEPPPSGAGTPPDVTQPTPHRD
ncbi:hypothetical protein SK069_08010 [Patulibacter brassicae]|jgi:hypothetical protein|uniref:Uncharacterized protein n=1 Tax=Patulibacter brassicae TaxID=1705717 RepID=A0ABU4VJD7_9ACTN|nr:hypothetical protein [Patulibacter brassicae]MDX8151530.1 hypothetical protein [Patulibacter brassicae]